MTARRVGAVPAKCPWCRRRTTCYTFYVACDNPNCWAAGPRRRSKAAAITAWNKLAAKAGKGRK